MQDIAVFRFYSLQTGKHIASSSSALYLSATACVSIPFKRESTLQADACLNVSHARFGFYSLQTGKHIASSRHAPLPRSVCTFLFPSNGKAHCKYNRRHILAKQGFFVSIPFKRESTLQERPHFKPSGAVAPKAQKYTRTAPSNF